MKFEFIEKVNVKRIDISYETLNEYLLQNYMGRLKRMCVASNIYKPKRRTRNITYLIILLLWECFILFNNTLFE